MKGKENDSNKVSSEELVNIALKHLEEHYAGGTKSREDAQRDSLKLSSARAMAEHQPVFSVTHELAVAATEEASKNDWKPMLDFLSHESIGVQLFAGQGNAPWIENLINSLKEAEPV